jgi:hydrogenase nickel incorporation protein HypA/HybF
MHELSIMGGLRDAVASVARRHGAVRAHRIAVDVGILSNVIPALLQQAFLAFREVDPLLRSAELVLHEVPARYACDGCGERWESGRYAARCPACGGAEVRLLQGEELLLRHVDLEIPEGAARD